MRIANRQENGFELIDVEYLEDALYDISSEDEGATVAEIEIEEVAEFATSATPTPTRSTAPFTFPNL